MDWIIVGVLIAIGLYLAPVIITMFMVVVLFILSIPFVIWDMLTGKNKGNGNGF